MLWHRFWKVCLGLIPVAANCFPPRAPGFALALAFHTLMARFKQSLTTPALATGFAGPLAGGGGT